MEVIDLTKQFNPLDIIDNLTYSCYRYNRQRSPDVTPKQWSCIFNNVELMEAKYQNELSEVQ